MFLNPAQPSQAGEADARRVVRAQRAAMTQSALAKERRELREQQQRTLLEAIPKDLSRPWEDPLPEAGERHLAQVLPHAYMLMPAAMPMAILLA